MDVDRSNGHTPAPPNGAGDRSAGRSRLRATLLVGAAFAAGLFATSVIGPVARDLGLSQFGFGTALAQDGSAADADGGAGHENAYQLLALFGDVFQQVKREYVEPVKSRELVENAINGMLTGLDPHSNYMNAKAYQDMQVQTEGEFGGLGIEVTAQDGFIKVVSPIDGTPAARAGVKPGDIITALNGKTVLGLSLNDAVDEMRGPANSKITLTIKRQGIDKPLELAMQREVIHIQVVKDHVEDKDIGYVRLSQFTEQSDSGLRDAITQLKKQSGDKLHAIVLDLRNNPGGLLDQAVAVADDFISQGELVSTRGRQPRDDQRWDAKTPDLTDGLPMVVLINGGSASASEIVAGALQDHHRAILVGTRSFGKGSVQTVIPLPGNGAMRLTTARYYTPSGRSIQGLGITPDVKVQSEATAVEHFGPERESDLNHTITNKGGSEQPKAAPRTDLPAIVNNIPGKPPANWPKFDAANPKTDFQLQQALVIAHAMAGQKRASAN